MNGQDLLEGLHDIDEDLIEAAETARPRGRRLRPWLLAACVCLALAGTACAVGNLWGVRIGELSTEEDASGYSVYGTVRTVPDAEFSQEVRDALQDNWDAWLAKDETSKIISSTLPGSVQRSFETWADGTEFLGIGLADPLEEADWLEQATAAGMSLDGGLGRKIGVEHCTAAYYGDIEGHIERASLAAGYRSGEIRVILRAEVQTEYAGTAAGDGSQDIETGSVWPEAVNLYTNSAVMPDGQTAALVISQPRREDSYVAIDAYFIQDGLLYTLNAVGPDGGDEAVAAVREVLEQALDCFA